MYGSASRHAEGGDGRIAGTAFGGAIAGSALLLAAAAIEAVAALRVGEQNEIDPQVATVMWDLQSILFGLAAPMAFAVLVLATAVLALRKGLLPSWHGAIIVVLGIAMLIPPINYIAIIAFQFWVLLTGMMLYLHPQPAESRSANTVV